MKAFYTWLKVVSHLVVRAGFDLICYSCYVLEVSGDPVRSDLTGCLCMLLFPPPPTPREFQLWMSGETSLWEKNRRRGAELLCCYSGGKEHFGYTGGGKGEPGVTMKGD